MSDPPTANQPHHPNRGPKVAANQPTNLNHLLNFTLPPRQSRPLSSIPRRSRKTGTTHGVWNKERFVNAQYRFVMNPNGDYTVHFADPDIFFQWSDILQVIIPRSSVLVSAAATGEQPLHSQDDSQTNCPICLSPPTAPRMTKCGHIFCFPCILHYLGTSDNKWARCPICFDSVNEKQLKSVKWFDWSANNTDDIIGSAPEASSSLSVIENAFENSPQQGAVLRMRLIERPQITTLALPRSHTWPSELLPPHQAPFHFLPDVYQFSKFMLATPSYLVSDLAQDLDELATERRLLAGMKDDLGVSFIDGAEAKVRQQIARAIALDTPILKEQIEKALKDKHELEERVEHHEQRQQDIQSLQEEIPTDFLASMSPGTRTPISASSEPCQVQESVPRSAASRSRNQPRQRRNINPPPPTNQTYYYYQAASGLPVYLHPLDIRILLAYFNNYSAFPDAITVRVDAFSESTVNNDLRKRCKYLAHTPEGADVVFIEANLEGVVGPDGLKNFEGLLKSRAARRKEKGKKDDRAKAKAEEREREKEKLWTSSGANSISRSDPISIPTPLPIDNFSALVASPPQEESEPLESSPPQQQQTSGAWGARSFASALHSPPAHPPSRGQQRGRASAEDEWDMDVAWHELEQRAGGRKKKGAKLVLLGGAGGRRR